MRRSGPQPNDLMLVLHRSLEPAPRKRTVLSVIAMSAAKGGHHKLLNPHSFRGMEFNDGDEGNQNENGQHYGLCDRKRWFSLRRSQRIECRNFHEALHD